MARGRPSRQTVYDKLARSLGELRQRLGGLPSPTQAEIIWSDIWHLEAHHSTALEGNTSVLREVEALLDDGRAVGAKPLKDYLEVKGYGDAARWVYRQAPESDEWSADGLISLNEVRRVHSMAMGPAWGMTPPPWPDVPALLRDWVDEVVGFGDEVSSGVQTSAGLPEVIAQAMLDNINRFVVPVMAGPSLLVPLASLVDKRYSVAALRQAAQRGRLEAIQGVDGVWMSTREAVVPSKPANTLPRRQR